MPQSTDYGTALVNVADRKADVTFIERHLASDFMAKNPGKIRKVKSQNPLRYYANGLEMDIADWRLLSMFNMTLEEMLGSGDIDAILARYKDDPLSSLPVAKPFVEK
jgi:ABC-type amino acid transport substrate-binding protein